MSLEREPAGYDWRETLRGVKESPEAQPQDTFKGSPRPVTCPSPEDLVRLSWEIEKESENLAELKARVDMLRRTAMEWSLEPPCDAPGTSEGRFVGLDLSVPSEPLEDAPDDTDEMQPCETWVSISPDDSTAPAWAEWVARDSNGQWFWYPKKPKLGDKTWFYGGIQCELAAWDARADSQGWKDTLRRVIR